MVAVFLISANLFYLAGIYLIPKYLFKYLIGKPIKSRYRFTMIFVAIGILQVFASALGYAVLPAYFLLLVYLMIFIKAAALMGYMPSELTDLFFWTILLSQAFAYAFIGFLFGILHEYYGTEPSLEKL